MAGQDTGQILKYFTEIIMVLLLTYECFVETLDVQFSYIDGQLHHRIPRSAELLEFTVVVEVKVSQGVMNEQIRASLASITFPLQVDNSTEITAADITTDNTSCAQPPTVTPVPAEYLTEIQIDAENTPIIYQLMIYLMAFNFPYIISDSSNITEINITTVCSLNETQYQCKCEGLFVWPNDTCHSYKACDVITDGSCTCINGLPVDRQFCQLKEVLPSNYVIDIDVRFFDLFVVNYLRNIIRNISLPLTLSNSMNVTDIDMTTVCGLNEMVYECKCEEHHVWPNDTCRAYQVCDGIVGGTCGCIQALPSEGPLCQRDINECEDAVSVCGQYSDCINIIGSHMCSCWSGFNTSNKDSPVSRNNSCQDIDECLFSPSVCGPNSNCTNEIGSYNCSCLDGFTATNPSLPISINNTCGDVHECLNTSEFCGPNSCCTNLIGSYNCSCLSGFTVTNMNQPVSISNPCNVTLPLTEYLIEIQINSVDSSITDQLRTLLMSFNLPYIISDSTNITEINITTVCSLSVQTQYQCKCEGLFVWPNDTCHSYEACDVITDGSCTCINGFPVDGQFCQAIDECLVSPSVCGPNANCANEIGSYSCSCLDGFTATNSSLPISINNPCRVLKMSMRVNQNFDTSLNNPEEEMFQTYVNTIKSAIEDSYISLSIYIKNSVKVRKFRPGSIIADYEISLTTNSLSSLNSANSDDFGLANTQVLRTLWKAGIPVALNAFF
ncbi:latent-transforming growth factor beta-binding protein 1 isoform X2 [Megalobrama amblycephala]|uniref:latent-transforming growth factor beta-binding protein 1 isoform X2 n=1 Tax=Megalobrama amblycephala TaxID=75352 RepID=UPI00201465F0|nr:latent-transforming growth factor beta-binding protein 1 isoform X2 [Megalobrama amblycephala]